jgi:hypothetical protein
VVLIILCGFLGGKTIAQLPIDPNMAVWYMFDESDGNTAYDSSGYNRHGIVTYSEASADWNPSDGRYGGSLGFDDDTSVAVPNDVLGNLSEGITISVWLKDAYRADTNNWLLDVYGEDTNHRISSAIPLEDGQTVKWQAGNDTNDVLLWDMLSDSIDPSTLLDWHFWVFTKDEEQGEMAIWFDCIKGASRESVDSTLADLRNEALKIGGLASHSNDFVGRADDFRVFDRVLTEAEIITACRPCCPEQVCAWAPQPYSGKEDVQHDVLLTWNPGDFAVEHHVFFGTSWEDVNAMTDPCAVKILGDESYDPGHLELGKTYYWRVDEVNDSNVRKCNIWNFTTSNYIIVDDFESYNDDNPIWDTWHEQGGAWIDHGLGEEPVHSGQQSMYYVYWNDLGHGGGYYSEIWRGFNGGMDWTSNEVKALTLYFYGDADNDAGIADQPYVGIDDGVNYAQVAYSPVSDLMEEEWHEWNIPIADFSSVTHSDVERIYLGFGSRGTTEPGGSGLVFFDDIRLYRPRCILEQGQPAGDLNDDCIVDYKDLEVIVLDWLNEGNIPADLYNDNRINFKDIAVLCETWMERQFWP